MSKDNIRTNTMTDNEHIKPLDLSRYEGHPDSKHWLPSSAITRAAESIAAKGTGSFKEVSAAQNLIADAPLLLAELIAAKEDIQELRERQKSLRQIIDEVAEEPRRGWFKELFQLTGEHWVLTEEGWIPASMNDKQNTGEDPMEVLDEVNARRVLGEEGGAQ